MIMLFNSLPYAVFLPIVFALYRILPHRFRWILLLFASYWFYMSWNPKYILLILFTTVTSFVAGLVLERMSGERAKRVTVALTAILCLGVLFFFKYFNFFTSSVTSALSLFGLSMHPVTLQLLLPVGISFYTFQTLSYVIDVSRGTISAAHHFGKYATFIAFFPQLVAGPIERSSHLLPQIDGEHDFSYDDATYGLKLMAWGYYKKIVIADTLTMYTGAVFEHPRNYDGFALLLAVLMFSVQIYCDFSGYSDIAIGTAKLFGINLMQNFRSPYLSASFKEFWSRWHISLSTWFRDYVYIPLGGSRRGNASVHLMITFLVSGLWHGASWTFVIWGGIHGLAQVIEKALPGRAGRETPLPVRLFRIFVVFCFCTFAWIFFAAETIRDAGYILRHIVGGISGPLSYLQNGLAAHALLPRDLIPLCTAILLLVLFDVLSLKRDVIAATAALRPGLRWTVYVAFMLWMVFQIPVNSTTEFIYFQF